ncbi:MULTISPECIES: hypothetical protein [Phaeobacter]|uniref:Uncharacterized protein n=2 Tax=Phaeobacter TaxID=302485 RepID=A0A2I7K9W3_9RHOB|nr:MULTISPECIES: hypothetical protein [Phaeobacter]APG45678.1 hypothetical protein PhaeoP97_00226 [Phaeobacter porticola]AUQ99353.1 hypothetical protein PhaeoP88_01983 [Phaeobacter inhibens]AXT33786.1 hypothetical protein D1820_01715 [Phaeobacter sp. LSS9]MDO6755394.1 hypothetical protein [Phaeobacter inhibens]UWR40230.1 hypothetical protein K4F85_12360 [Phaeobacter inhibens]
MRKFAFFVVPFAAACSVSLPVNGQFDGEPAQGTATASLSGGTFQVLNTRGLSCAGTYDAGTTAITIRAPVSCTDGRTGNAIITRKTDLISGTAIVRLNDGTTGEFVFGDLQYGEEF